MIDRICERIAPGLPGVIVSSHGPLAVAILESAEMILGELENVDAFSLEISDSPLALKEELKKAICKYPEGAIVFVDILGGTPSNQLLSVSAEIDSPLYAFAGVNFPILLEAISSRKFMSVKELMDSLDSFNGKSICNLTKLLEE